MKRLTYGLFLVVVWVLSGCSSVRVVRDYDREASFKHLQRFSWEHVQQPKTGHPRIDNELVDRRIRAAVEASLQSKGFERVSRNDEDFRVAYYIEFKRKLGGSSLSLGLGFGGYGRYGGGVGYGTGRSDYEVGILIIDIIDARSNEVIWRGSGSRVLYEGSDPDKATRIVNEAVDKILGYFPPVS